MQQGCVIPFEKLIPLTTNRTTYSQVLQHVTGEISVKLVDLANTSAVHQGRVSVICM